MRDNRWDGANPPAVGTNWSDEPNFAGAKLTTKEALHVPSDNSSTAPETGAQARLVARSTRWSEGDLIFQAIAQGISLSLTTCAWLGVGSGQSARDGEFVFVRRVQIEPRRSLELR